MTDNCIFWDHLRYWDQFIEKIPEKIKFCMKCVDRFPDDNKYKGESWRLSWEFGKGYYNKNLDGFTSLDRNERRATEKS